MPAGSFLNGASHAWTLDLAREFPGRDVRFGFGPNLDDTTTNLRLGPLDVGNVWVASVMEDDHRGLVGIDRVSGKVLWSDLGHPVETCAVIPGTGTLACAWMMSRGQSSFGILDATSGAVSRTASFPGSWPYVVANADGIVFAVGSWEGSARSLTLVGMDAAGGERWRRQVAVSSDADAADAGIPMGTRGHVATYEWYGGEIAVDVATGADRPTGENRSFSVVTAPSGEQFLYSSGAKEQGAVCAVEDLSKCVDISGSLPDDALLFVRADQNDATATALAAFVPAVSPTSLVLPGATLASAAPAGGAGRPSQIPACSAGTRELAWATFSSGWILVCGIDGRPTVWVSSTGGVQRQSNSPEWDPGLLRFTTSFDDGSSGWLSWAPATAGWSGPDGAVTSQESVGLIWFVDLGGTRATEGSFGVRAPDATADDQVRYLSAILGAALSASKKADEAYARWARAIHAQGCGAASEAEGAAMSAEAGRWKTAFAARWNSVIAPAFGVSAVTREKL